MIILFVIIACTNVTVIDECLIANKVCHQNATCHNTDGNLTCSCDIGFVGDGFTCYGTLS